MKKETPKTDRKLLAIFAQQNNRDKALISAGYPASDLISAGYSLSALRLAGYPASDLENTKPCRYIPTYTRTCLRE